MMSDINNIQDMINRIIEGPVFEHLMNGDTQEALYLSFNRRGVFWKPPKSEHIIEMRMVTLSAVGQGSREELIDFVETAAGLWYASKGTVQLEDIVMSLTDVAVTGRVRVSNIDSISSEEFDPYHHLSDYLGVDREELRGLISTGSVTVDDFRGAMRAAVSLCQSGTPKGNDHE